MLGLETLGPLWLGLLIVPVLIFYFLRMRFQRQPISSIYIWSRLQNATHGGSSLRRRSFWLLLLELAALVAAITALTHPYWVTRHSNQPGIIFLVDISGSMATVESREPHIQTRIDLARVALNNMIQGLPPGVEGMIFLCHNKAEALGQPTSDHRILLDRIRMIRPSETGFVESEVALDLETWLGKQSHEWKNVLLTDGGLDLGGSKLATIFNGRLNTKIVGVSRYNIGLSGLQINSGSKQEFQIFNSFPTERRVLISLDLNGRTLAEQEIIAPPGISHQQFAKTVRYQAGIYRIQLKNTNDDLSADNRNCFAVNLSHRFRVLRIGPANPFLQAALDNPQIELTERSSVPNTEFYGTDWDLVIFDRVSVPRGVQANYIAFGAVPPGIPIKKGQPVQGSVTVVDKTHPLLRFVDWSDIQAGQGFSLNVGRGAQVLAAVKEEPILAVWNEQGYQRVIWGIDLLNSNLGLSAGFPVFLQNLFQWLTPQWNNPLAYNLTVGVPRVLGGNPPLSFPEKQHLNLIPRNNWTWITAYASGGYHWRQGDRQGFLAANPPFAEFDITPRQLTFDRKMDKTVTALWMERHDLTQMSLMGLLICLFAEWLNWRGVPPFMKRGE